jgi:MYXO-CTERM domain-containing protein
MGVGKHRVELVAGGGPSGPVTCAATFDVVTPDAGLDAAPATAADAGATPPLPPDAPLPPEHPDRAAPDEGLGCACRSATDGSACALWALLMVAGLAWRRR